MFCVVVVIAFQYIVRLILFMNTFHFRAITLTVILNPNVKNLGIGAVK